MRKIFIEIFGCPFLVGLLSSSCLGATLEDEKIELEKAKNKLKEQAAYVLSLQEEIARKEIERIQREVIAIFHQDVSKTHLSNSDWLALFHEQREVLSQIIHNHPSLREGAQVVLDEILMLITEMSDLEESHGHSPPTFYSSK